jgi:hypothetical protein
MVITGCERTVWRVRSPKEIESFNKVIKPLPDSVLRIPEFDGKHTIPVVRFSFDHFSESWEYVIFNNGDVLYNRKLIGNMSQNDIQSLIHELNIKGLFGVRENGIFYKLAGPRRMSIFELLLPSPSQLFPPVLLDGATHTIQIDLKGVNYYISFYAVFYYVENFPTCQGKGIGVKSQHSTFSLIVCSILQY